jgi:CRISPR-associated protein Csb1
MFEELDRAKRLLMEIELVPVQGQRFQPTGFPDLGGATYQLPDGTRMLLVESVQSMANRLEHAIIGSDNEIRKELNGLSYVRAHLKDGTETVTNSLIEAHRINSPYIISNKDFRDRFVKDADYGKNLPLNWRKIAAALFKYDVNSLLHGVFLANIEGGRIKAPRVLTAFIEAINVREVVSGGVKNNIIDPTGTLRAEGSAKDVYGNVPYQRTEYTAETIRAYFNLDLGLLKSYKLGPDASELLTSLALYKIRSFLNEGTRLRTACDFRAVGELKVMEPKGAIIPQSDALLSHLQQKIVACRSLFADPPVTELTVKVKVQKKGGDEGPLEASEE